MLPSLFLVLLCFRVAEGHLQETQKEEDPESAITMTPFQFTSFYLHPFFLWEMTTNGTEKVKLCENLTP